MQLRLYQNGAYHNSSAMGIDPKSTALAMAIARLYYANQDGKFNSMKLGGVLCLVADRQLHSRFLRLYDINSSELLFQTELYINFHLKYKELSDNDYFYWFPLEKITIGIQFANVHDASIFKNLIQTYSFQGDDINELVKEQQSKMGNFNYDISRPLSFERKEHAGWDPVTQTFILNEIPKEIKVLLKKAGFKKKDLKTKETALAIYEILLREVEFDSLNAKNMVTGAGSNDGSARTSSNLNILTNRLSGMPNQMASNMAGERSMSINYGFQTQNTLGLQNDIGGRSQIMNNFGGQAIAGRSSSPLKFDSMVGSASMMGGVQEEQKTAMKVPPIPPPLVGMIPPPPMGMPPPSIGGTGPGFHLPQPPPMGKVLPPPPGGKIPPPNINPGQTQPNLSFNEQLILQSQNLKKVQNENQINSKVKNLSESQQMKITMNLAVVLEQRKKALLNDDAKNNSSEDSNDDGGNESDGSAW